MLYTRSAGIRETRTKRVAVPKLDQAKTRNDFLTAANVLKAFPDSNGKVGVVGFCYGGGIANFLATRIPDLGAAVSFYGGQPNAEETAAIKAPLLLHYAGADDRVNAGWPAYEAALKSAGLTINPIFILGYSMDLIMIRLHAMMKLPQS